MADLNEQFGKRMLEKAAFQIEGILLRHLEGKWCFRDGKGAYLMISKPESKSNTQFMWPGFNTKAESNIIVSFGCGRGNSNKRMRYARRTIGVRGTSA